MKEKDRYALSVQDRSAIADHNDTYRRRCESDVCVFAAECTLLAARLESLAHSFDLATSNSLNGVATELRRADASLRAIVRLSKASAPTGDPR